jgi:uncharacterized protein YdhG (YjbR/CyaY superfamily)
MTTTKTMSQTIDEYIAGFPEEVQGILEKLRGVIRAAAPDAAETINYQIPTFTLAGNLVHFAAYKNHIGFYPAPSGIAEFENELSPYEKAKGSVKFPQFTRTTAPTPFPQFSARSSSSSASRGTA